MHYERQPYRNHRVLNDAARHVTRFIGLGRVGNAEKRKWVYAFNIVPLKHIDRSELVKQPAEATDAPYNAVEVAAAAERLQGGGGGQQGGFFWDMNAPMDDRKGNRRRNNQDDFGGGGQKRQRREPAGPCWFCLSGSEVEKHLIVSIGDHAYLALPKGGLTPDHVLILPIAHHASLLELPEDVGKEVDRFKSAVRKCFKKRGQAVVFFERNYK